MKNLFDYFTRVDFEEIDLQPILKEICNKYGFSKLNDYHVIETGYEDFNVYLQTLDNKYVVKFFSNE